MEKPKIWCPLAFNGILSVLEGRYHTCCWASKNAEDPESGQILSRETHTIHEAFDNKFFQQIRDNLKNGIRDSNCNRCWQEEDAGVESLRISESKRLSELEKNFNGVELKYVDIALGNQCNLRCRSCNPVDSSLWAREYFDTEYLAPKEKFIHFKKKHSFLESPDSKFINNFIDVALPKITHLTFFGGEPFLMKSTWKILKAAIEKNVNQNINLAFDTNCTIWDKEKADLLGKFKEVTIRLSIDDIENRFEYLRYPAKWITVLSNFDQIKKWQEKSFHNRKILINLTVSAYNIWYLPEIINFLEKKNLDILINPVIEPESINIQNIPQEVKKDILKKLRSYNFKDDKQIQINKLINYYLALPDRDKHWTIFAQEVKKRDKYRNQSFHKVFYEFYKIIQLHNIDI